jgi:hypothetical protein
VDMEIDVSKMHEHFHKNTAYVQTQKDFWTLAEVEHKNTLSHSKIRWLPLMPAVKKIVVVYSAVASYFLATEKVHYVEEFFLNVNSPFHIWFF